MADDVERLILEMSADLKKLDKGVTAGVRIAERRFSALEKRALMSSTAIERAFGNIGGSIQGALASIGVGLAIREVGQYADTWTRAGNLIRAAGLDAAEAARMQDELTDSALRSRSSADETYKSFARIRRATQDIGATNEQVARSVEILNKAFVAGGAATQEQISALQQLGQGLASGVLQGDELRSIRENAPLVAKAIADEFETTIGGLKELGAEGKLTSDRVFAAILKAGADVERQFAQTTPTIADSFQTLQTEATRFIGQLDKAVGASERLTLFIRYVAENLDALAAAAVVAAAAVGGALAGQAIIRLITGAGTAAATLGITAGAIRTMGVSATAASASMVALRGAMAFLGGPWGVAITAIGVAVGVLAAKTAQAERPTEDLQRVSKTLTEALRAYEIAAIDASVATDKDKKSALEAVRAKKALAVEATEAAKAQLKQAQATLALLAAERARIMNNVDSSYMGEGSAPASAGQLVMNDTRRRQAQANFEQAKKDIEEAESAIRRIDGILNGPGLTGTSGGAEDSSAAAAREARKAEQLARRRADLVESAAIENARAADDLDEIRRLEDMARLRALILDYEDAGLSKADAKAQAEKDQNAWMLARLEGEAKAQDIYTRQSHLERAQLADQFDTVRSLERQLELEERIVRFQELGLDLAKATAAAETEQEAMDNARASARDRFLRDTALAHQLELARLGTDRQRITLLEREAAIRERTRQLRDEGGLSPSAAGAQAVSEVDALIRADLQGKFRQSFRDGVRAAIQGDIGGYLTDLTADLADRVLGRSLDVVADQIFALAEQFAPALFSQLGGDVLGAAAAGATIATAVTTSGTVAATAMGTAVASGGAAAAAAIAAAMGTTAAAAGATALAGSFGGFRAAGGPARFITEERGPEGFAQTAPGVVFSTAAMRGLSDLGRLAKEGRIGGGDVNIQLVNETGVPATANAERMPGGDMKVSLVPLVNQMLDGAGRSGDLAKSLRHTPQHRRRG